MKYILPMLVFQIGANGVRAQAHCACEGAWLLKTRRSQIISGGSLKPGRQIITYMMWVHWVKFEGYSQMKLPLQIGREPRRRKGSHLWREEKFKDIEKLIQETGAAQRRKVKEQFYWKGEGIINISMKGDRSELRIK